MTLAVPPEKIDAFLALARRRGVEATVLGEFTDSGCFHVTHGEETVAFIEMAFLHDGLPEMKLTARWTPPVHAEPAAAPPEELGRALLAMLGRLNLCSGEGKARHYDHEVKGLTVVRPFVGVGHDVPAEATVFLAAHDSERGFVLSEGINPFYSDIDTHAMAGAVVDEAVRRQLCAGARFDRIALLDNFCWPDPVESKNTPDGAYKLAQLVRACRGLYEATRAYGTPLISGKDSMKNEAVMAGVKIGVPPTLLVSAVGQIDDVRRALTLEPKAAGDAIFLLGETRDETGAGEYFRWLGEGEGPDAAFGDPRPWVGNKVPRLDLAATVPLYRALAAATETGLVRSATAPAKGGWGLAFARTAMAGACGLDLDLGACADLAGLAPDVALFSESTGRFLVTVAPADADEFARRFEGMACRRVGAVTEEPRLRVRDRDRSWLDLEVADLASAFKETLADG